MRVVRYYVTVDMLTVNRDQDSEFPGLEAASQRPEGPKRRKLNSDGQSSVLRSAEEADNVSPYCLVPQYTPV